MSEQDSIIERRMLEAIDEISDMMIDREVIREIVMRGKENRSLPAESRKLYQRAYSKYLRKLEKQK